MSRFHSDMHDAIGAVSAPAGKGAISIILLIKRDKAIIS